MNGSRSVRLTPAKARRTGNPSPSSPAGAVVTDLTGRSRPATGSGGGTRGSANTFSTVTAGIVASFASDTGWSSGRTIFARATFRLGPKDRPIREDNGTSPTRPATTNPSVEVWSYRATHAWAAGAPAARRSTGVVSPLWSAPLALELSCPESTCDLRRASGRSRRTGGTFARRKGGAQWLLSS